MRMAFEMCGSFWRSAKKQLDDDFLLAFFFFDLLFGRVLIRCCWGALPSFTFYINIFIYGCGSGSRLSLDSRSSGGGRPHRRPIGIRSISALTMTLSSDARDARAALHTKKCQKNHMCITLIFIALTYKSFNYRLLVAKKKIIRLQRPLRPEFITKSNKHVKVSLYFDHTIGSFGFHPAGMPQSWSAWQVRGVGRGHRIDYQSIPEPF